MNRTPLFRHKTVLTGSETRGFTLLELLISVSILTILMSLVYISFSSVTNTMDLARDSADRLRFKQIIWRNLSSNLQGVYVDPGAFQPEYQFLGENEEGAYGPGDRLTFATTVPLPGARSLPGVAKVVTYELADYNTVSPEIAAAIPYDASRPGGILLIREEPLQLQSQDFVERVSDKEWDLYERAVPAASMDILYYDGLQNEWAEEWDSLEQRRLPGGIWIKINFARNEEERIELQRSGINPSENPDLEYMLALPLGRDVEFPFADFNHIRFEALEEMEPGAQSQ